MLETCRFHDRAVGSVLRLAMVGIIVANVIALICGNLPLLKYTKYIQSPSYSARKLEGEGVKDVRDALCFWKFGRRRTLRR